MIDSTQSSNAFHISSFILVAPYWNIIFLGLYNNYYVLNFNSSRPKSTPKYLYATLLMKIYAPLSVSEVLAHILIGKNTRYINMLVEVNSNFLL